MNGPSFTVDLPGGGQLTLESSEEVTLWNHSAQRYIDDYALQKQNDLVLLGAILTQGLTMYRAQQSLADPKKVGEAQNRITKAADQIRELEKALGIDKKSREAGGQHTVGNYLETLKKAAHEKGVRIVQRTKDYEEFVMAMRWKIRLLRNGDAEDRAVHGISEESIVIFAEEELAKLEKADQEWAHTKGRLYVGKV